MFAISFKLASSYIQLFASHSLNCTGSSEDLSGASLLQHSFLKIHNPFLQLTFLNSRCVFKPSYLSHDNNFFSEAFDKKELYANPVPV